MAIKTGKYGTVKYTTDPAGLAPALTKIISLNSWKLSSKRDKEDITCFEDENKIYLFGPRDYSGTVGGFWNSADVTLWEAAETDAPGLLELAPNLSELTFKWSGLAMFDVDIDCSLAAPKVSGSFAAAGNWTRTP